jgi:biopolymer transport protein ExbD
MNAIEWKVRHEGSNRVVGNLTLGQVVEGLQDGHWEPTDEVQGPEDADWQAIENHPSLAETAADLEPPPPRTYDDETRLDMNPLIDVCLVLLVFFILTTSYAALQKRLEAPSVSDAKDSKKMAVYTKKQVEESMILVRAVMEQGQPVIRVENKVVDPKNLYGELRRFARSTGKTILLLEHDDDVPHDLVVRIIDQAKGAGLDRVRLVVP